MALGAYSLVMFKIFKKINLYLCILLTLFFSFTPAKVFGLDYGFYSSNDILYYDPNGCAKSDGSSNLTGNDNLEKILRYYVGKGLTLAQASGIAGNFQQESGFEPLKIEGGDVVDNSYTPVDGEGYGIAQWTFSERQVPLMDLAKSTNRQYGDLSLQLDFSWQELNSNRSGALVSLKEATTPEDAAYVFHRDFEGSNDSEEFVKSVRGGNAKAIYDEYQSTIQDGSGSSSNSSASCNAESGKASDFINGFAIYDQYDSQWADKPYGGSATIAESGCGPSAMAMIVTALTGQAVTPLDTATYGAANGTTANDGADGSNWNIQTVIGEHWGLKSTQIGASVNEINTALQGGALIITSGSGAAPFTAGGHYIVIRAVTAEGKWLIGDSNGSKGTENSKTEWDPETILNGMAKGNVWAVTK